MIPLLRYIRYIVPVLTLVLAGCASNGYISSVITTGIGLDVSENPQTQVPHVRFGYIRNGLYYIPTGKTGDPNGNADETPHVVSKIHVSSEFLKNIEISEKFAVGDKAVKSGSAQILFQDTSSERAHTSAPPDVLQPVQNDNTSGEPLKPRGPTTISEERRKELEAARAIRITRAAAVKAFNGNLKLIYKFPPAERDQAFAEIVKATHPIPPPDGDGQPVPPTYASINKHFQDTHTPQAELEAMAAVAAEQIKKAKEAPVTQ